MEECTALCLRQAREIVAGKQMGPKKRYGYGLNKGMGIPWRACFSLHGVFSALLSMNYEQTMERLIV